MESFQTKTINSVDYIKATEIANFYGKNKHHAGRFIRETFSESDIVKSNATLFVRKSAVDTHMHKHQDIIDRKTKELDLKIREAEAAKRNYEEKVANIEWFEKNIVKNYQSKMRMMRLDEHVLTDLHFYIQQSKNFKKADSFVEYVHKHLKKLETLIEKDPYLDE